MRDRLLLELGYLAIERGLLDTGLIAAALRIRLAEQKGNSGAIETAQRVFTGRVRYLARCNVIEVIPAPKKGRSA